ncbi:MAG: ABC transporter substrate-binding protein [Pyrinomonadaceae bacterium]
MSALLSTCILLLTSCGSAPTTGNQSTAAKIEARTTGARGGTLTYRLTTPPKTFNYLLANDEYSIVAGFYTITSRLIDFEHSTQTFVPALAESWTPSPDGKTVDVVLREALKFSDGREITTDDVAFTLSAMYDKSIKESAFRDAMLIDGKPIEIKKIDARRLQMIFPKAVASAENYLVNIGVLPAHILKSDLDAGTLAEAWKINTAPASIVASGPFVITAAAPNERIEYARNPNYWKKDSAGTQLPYLDKFVIEVVPDANNTFVRLSQGSLDFADRIRPNDFTELGKTAGAMRAVDVGPGLSIDHIFFNLNTSDPSGNLLQNSPKRAWFADKRFRQAIAAAIDRESITSISLQGLASPLHGFVSPANSVWLKKDLAKIGFDAKRAEELLRQAGFQKGGADDAPTLSDPAGNPVEFTLLVPTENEARKTMASVIQQDLAKIGIKMAVVPLEFAAISERWNKTYDYEAILLGLSQTDIEPSSYQNFLLSSAGTHQWQPKQKTPTTAWEAKIDELFAAQSVELDRQKRMAIFHEIQTIMREEMPVIPLAARHVVAAAHSRIGNYSPSAIFPYSSWNIDELFIRQ